MSSASSLLVSLRLPSGISETCMGLLESIDHASLDREAEHSPPNTKSPPGSEQGSGNTLLTVFRYLGVHGTYEPSKNCTYNPLISPLYECPNVVMIEL